jgi:HK97 family phage prohead protease
MTLIERRGVMAREQRETFHLPVEIRDQGEDSPLVFTGYASTTGQPYSVTDWAGTYNETIERGAFDKTLAEGDDVRLLINHDGLPLARWTGRGVAGGDTMTLRADEVGLQVEALLDRQDPDVQRVAPKMRRGDLTQMSFGFQVMKQEWSKDYSERSIREVRLFDVSVVTYPANPATSATVRQQLVTSRIPVERLAAVMHELRAGATLSKESLAFLVQALEALSDASEDVAEAQDAIVDLMQSAGVLPDVGADDNPDGSEMDNETQMGRSLTLAFAQNVLSR